MQDTKYCGGSREDHHRGGPELAVEGNGPVESNSVLTKAVKRPNEDSDEDEEKGAVVPPVHDIYRARQQKRIR